MVAHALAVVLASVVPVAVVVDDGARLALTPDGTSWQPLTPPHIGPIDDAKFLDARHGWVVSQDCTAGKGEVARTADGGRTWRSVSFGAHSCSAGSSFTLDFVDARHGWILETEGSGGFARLWRTLDGGDTWKPIVDRLPGLGSAEFGSRGEGWLGGFDGLYRSRDAGRHWRRVEAFGKRYGSFAPPRLFRGAGVAAATTRHALAAFRTADAGRTWRRTLVVPLPAEPSIFGPARLSAPIPNVCWLTVRGARTLLYVSNDGGRSWAKRPMLPAGAGALQALDGATAVLPVYRSGRFGVRVTHDGGRTWRPR